MSRGKVTVAERIEAAKACAEGRISQTEAAHRLGVDRTSILHMLVICSTTNNRYQSYKHNIYQLMPQIPPLSARILQIFQPFYDMFHVNSPSSVNIMPYWAQKVNAVAVVSIP